MAARVKRGKRERVGLVRMSVLCGVCGITHMDDFCSLNKKKIIFFYNNNNNNNNKSG